MPLPTERFFWVFSTPDRDDNQETKNGRRCLIIDSEAVITDNSVDEIGLAVIAECVDWREAAKVVTALNAYTF